MTTVLVTGAGGFIGWHLARYLRDQGNYVIGVDVKRPEFGESPCHTFMLADLRDLNNCLRACRGVAHVYHLAASVGGLGFIHEGNHAEIARNNTLINLNMLEAARMQGVSRFLFTSSAVVYPQYLQQQPDVTALKEDMVWPADPAEGGYGHDKLYTEQLCRWYREGFGLETRVARLHNSYGPQGTWRGGREKAPAALCRKVAEATQAPTVMSNKHTTFTGLEPPSENNWFSLPKPIDVWGDGTQTRSFTYVNDTVEGLYRLMQSDYPEPVNIGSSELVSINDMLSMIAEIAGVHVAANHIEGPVGVLGRNSDNTLCREVLGWEPMTPLRVGLTPTYYWIAQQVAQRAKVAA